MKPNIDFGKLFIDFVLSKKGQMVLENCERLPARPDMDTESLRAFKGIKLYPSDLTLADKITVYSKQFAEAMRLR